MYQLHPLLLRDDILGLRAPEQCDAGKYQLLRNDLDSVGNLIGFARGLSRSRIAEWIEKIDNRSTLTLTAVLLSTHEPIGYVYVSEVEPLSATCHVGLAVFAPEDRRKGYGRRIMSLTLDYMRECLKVRKVTLRVLADNHGAVSLYKALGFEVEGTLKEHHFIAGRYRDVLLMAKFLT